METNLEVILIGGGPAGTAAAITASESGLNVAMIVKPVRKVKAESEPLQSVHPGLDSLLASFGAEKAVSYASRNTYQGIVSQGVFTPLSTITGEDWNGHHISRHAFNEYLSFCARKRSIQIIEDDEVSDLMPDGVILRSGRKLLSRYIIDASGFSRFAGKRLQISEEFYSPPLTACTGVAIDLPQIIVKDLVTSFIPESFGWTWLAPHHQGNCTWVRVGLTKQVTLRCPGELASANQHSAISSSNVRWRLFKKITLKNILLTGDAAGIIDAGAGQGILRACWSGIMAAQTVIAIINSGKSQSFAMRTYQDLYFDNYHSTAAQLKTYYKNLGIIFS